MKTDATIMRSLSKALDMNDLVVSGEEIESDLVSVDPPFELTPQEKDADDDFSSARIALTNALSKGIEALNSAVLVATNSQKQGGYEAVSSLLKEVTDATQKLMNLHDLRRGLVAQENANNQSSDPAMNALIGSAQNVIVVKNPAALSQMMRQMKDERQRED